MKEGEKEESRVTGMKKGKKEDSRIKVNERRGEKREQSDGDEGRKRETG